MTMDQPTLFDVGTVNMRQFAPVTAAAEGARAYTHGAYNPQGLENRMADPVRGYKVQKAYREAEAASGGRNIRQSYEHMRRGINEQHDFLTRPREQGGLGFQHEVVDHDPYPTPQAMAADVAQGKIKTQATRVTGPHHTFTNEENDRFRAVHDVFGHAATGRGFDRNGEEAAFLSHRQMFPKRAIAALASETRGQNSVLNYGHGNFSDQTKMVGLPSWASRP